MTGKELLQMTEELDEYYWEYEGFFGRIENSQNARRFARGQLGPIERKSLEPIADAEGINPRRLQLFFSRAEWDEDGARDYLQRRIAEKYGGEDGIFIIDETSDAKKGMWTAGVDAQYCGESGKIDNCITSVHLGYTRGGLHWLLDGELFLPKSWNPNPDDDGISVRRKRAQVPDDVVHEPKTVMAMRQLRRAVANGMPGRYVTADELYGRASWWRREIDNLGLIYVVEIPRDTRGWIAKRSGEALRVDELAASDRCGRKKRLRTHETEKGPEVWECRQAGFHEQAEAAPRKQQQLLVARNVRTDETKYFISNAPDNMKTEQLLCIAFSRWRIERCFQDCKSELGLNHAEIRTYRGLHRHFILTAINYCFLQEWLGKHKRGEKRSHSRAVRRRRASLA
jgi:SRSO17 transposase